MINILFGLPGGGKSTSASYIANKAIKHPNKPIYIAGVKVTDGQEKVFTNFYMQGAYEFKNFEDLGNYLYKDSIIVIDEGLMYADGRNWKDWDDSLTWFFTQHRKLNCSVIVSVQSFNALEKRIKILSANIFHVEPFIFDFFKITHIAPFSDIRGNQITEGYEYGRSKYIWGKPIFKLFDSYEIIGKNADMPEPELVLWNRKEPINIEELGD